MDEQETKRAKDFTERSGEDLKTDDSGSTLRFESTIAPISPNGLDLNISDMEDVEIGDAASHPG